ncbi:MAG TPA: HAMP domain-containing histidine kinase, partial [Deltaproteobacteria bacterium]|nr:HAMP domain-containing histidine kinase [Deltaproteobacteria bacterium]
AEYAGAAPHHPFGDLFPRHVHSDGRYLLVLYFVFASSILFTTHIASNISERLAEREEELRAKSRQLEAALAELREKDRLKSEYVRVVAHDMKSPLASALSLISVLLGGYAGPLEPKAREVVERMGRKLEYLHHYAKDLLDLSRMRSARFLSLQPVEIAPLVEEALALAAAKKEDKRINIVVDTSTAPKEITADREQLLHVLINLVANALKYTPDGGAVTIRAATEADRLRIDVSDTGIGIPPDELPRIFDEFYRGRNVAKTTKGTGLGLALVKEMVERHGGSVSVESRPHQGTRFTVKMPLRQEPLAPDRRDGL